MPWATLDLAVAQPVSVFCFVEDKEEFGRWKEIILAAIVTLKDAYLAKETALFSLITVTLICPGYCISV